MTQDSFPVVQVCSVRSLSDSSMTVALPLFALALVLLLPACERKQEPAGLPKLVAEEGVDYFVGGPIMALDSYGRIRLKGFAGPVLQPTSRGLLAGVKVDEDGRFDYRTWLNGRLAQRSYGSLDENGLYWYTERLIFGVDGVLAMRKLFSYDDDGLVMTVTAETIDTETGETLATEVTTQPYAPPKKVRKDKDKRKERRARKRAAR